MKVVSCALGVVLSVALPVYGELPQIPNPLPIPIPGTTPVGPLNPGSPLIPVPIPPLLTPLLPAEFRKMFDDGVKEVNRSTEKLGNDTLTTIKKANDDTIRTFQKAGGDAISTFQKAGSDVVTTVSKTANDATATYVKAWRDTGEQTQRSLKDAIDAGQAVEHFVQNQAKAHQDQWQNAEKRLREGKVIDSMWGLSVEPAQASEQNFAKATQESKVIAAAAQSAAAAYGGPAGAAAYAAWSTYRATGDANLALRAGVVSAVTSQGGSIGTMPTGTTGEVLKKAALAGAAGGIAVAAAGGDKQAVQDGFIKSAGAVLIQAGSSKLTAYSPKSKDALSAVHCISAKDVDCLSNTTYVRDAKGRILLDRNGKPRIDPAKLDPRQYSGNWTHVDPNSPEGQTSAFIRQVSKLPKTEAIPLMNNRWVLTWTLGRDKALQHNKPTVVLTYVGTNPPFISRVKYGRVISKKAQPSRSTAAANIVTAKNSVYSCPVNGSNREVKVSYHARGCDAAYAKERGVSQNIWHSDVESQICAAKAAAFVSHLEKLGIQCTAR